MASEVDLDWIRYLSLLKVRLCVLFESVILNMKLIQEIWVCVHCEMIQHLVDLGRFNQQSRF